MALVNKARMLDLAAGQAKKMERVPQEAVDEAMARLIAILE